MQNTIYEYESISNEELKNHIINTTELHKYFTLDWKDLKAKQYCGILNFDNQDFYILPKIVNHNDEKNLNIFTQLSHIKNHQFLMCKSFLKPINRHFLI